MKIFLFMLVVQEFYYNMPRYVFYFALFFSYQTCLEFRSSFKLQTQVCIYSGKIFIYFCKVTVSHPSFTSVSLWKTYYSSAKSLDSFMSVFHFLHLFLFCSLGDFFYLTFLVTNVNINRVHSFLQFTYCLFVWKSCLFGYFSSRKIFGLSSGVFRRLFLQAPTSLVWSFSEWWHHIAVLLPFLLLLARLGSGMTYRKWWWSTKRKERTV